MFYLLLRAHSLMIIFYRNACVSIGRNEFGDLMVRLNTGIKNKMPTDYMLQNIKVFHKLESL